MNKRTIPPNPCHKEFNTTLLARDYGCEILAYMGQPMLYDGELYVLREPLKTQWEYHRWVRGIRVV
jgi:hypothetical protein